MRGAAVSSLAALETVLANLESGVLLLEAKGRVLYSNQALADLFGIPADRISRMTRDQFFREVAGLCDDSTEALDKLAALAGAAEPAHDDLEIQQPKWIQVGCVAKPVPLANASGQLLTFTNITAAVDLADARQSLALTDELTGLPNRRAGEQAVAREVARAHRSAQPLSFALFDVDHFKRVNDTFGHAAGDRVLKEVATLIAEDLRGGDIAVRWGGEEFLAILGDIGILGARAFAERVRGAVERMDLTSMGVVTISAGISEYQRDEPPEVALERADARLYEAKSQGRNRVCC
jgi:diguanylate cyclase (GGDEF)-like protein